MKFVCLSNVSDFILEPIRYMRSGVAVVIFFIVKPES